MISLTSSSITISISQSNSLSVPVGTIWPYTGDLNEIPDDWHLCDGTNGTPDLRGRFLQSYSDSLLVNNYIEAGLPNLTGELGIGNIGNFSHSANYAMGVFNYKNGVSSSADYRTGISSVTVIFNASFSNHIYGNSDTVQPAAYTVYYIMKI